jgi:hypothetical protein
MLIQEKLPTLIRILKNVPGVICRCKCDCIFTILNIVAQILLLCSNHTAYDHHRIRNQLPCNVLLAEVEILLRVEYAYGLTLLFFLWRGEQGISPMKCRMLIKMDSEVFVAGFFILCIHQRKSQIKETDNNDTRFSCKCIFNDPTY